MNPVIIIVIVALALINFWIIRGALSKKNTPNKKRKNTPKSELKSLAELVGKEVAEQEGNTILLDFKSIPNASGPYGLSPTNPICCGNMVRMHFVYERIHFHETPIQHSQRGQGTLWGTDHHVRVIRHKPESGIPNIYFTYDFYYEDCRAEAPEMSGFTMK